MCICKRENVQMHTQRDCECACMCVLMCMCQVMHVEVRGQLSEDHNPFLAEAVSPVVSTTLCMLLCVYSREVASQLPA